MAASSAMDAAFGGGQEGLSFYEQQVLGDRRMAGQERMQGRNLDFQRWLESIRSGQFNKQFGFQQAGRAKRFGFGDSLEGFGMIDPEQKREMISANYQSSVQPMMRGARKAFARLPGNVNQATMQRALYGVGQRGNAQYGQQIDQMNFNRQGENARLRTALYG